MTVRVLARHHGRGEMELQTIPRAELALQLALERAVRVKPRDLVLVLDGHELEEPARRSLAQGRRAGTDAVLRLAHRLDAAFEVGGVARALVVRQELDAAFDDLIEAFADLAILERVLALCQRSFDALRVVRGAASPVESRQIHFYGLTVQLDRAGDGIERQGHAARLPRMAEHDHVGGDGVGEQSLGGVGRVEEERTPLAARCLDRFAQFASRQGVVGASGEIAGHHFGGVGDDEGAIVDRFQNLLGARHNEIAAQDQIGPARRDPNGRHFGRLAGDAHVAEHRAPLLREPCHVDHAAT